MEDPREPGKGKERQALFGLHLIHFFSTLAMYSFCATSPLPFNYNVTSLPVLIELYPDFSNSSEEEIDFNGGLKASSVRALVK